MKLLLFDIYSDDEVRVGLGAVLVGSTAYPACRIVACMQKMISRKARMEGDCIWLVQGIATAAVILGWNLTFYSIVLLALRRESKDMLQMMGTDIQEAETSHVALEWMSRLTINFGNAMSNALYRCSNGYQCSPLC